MTPTETAALLAIAASYDRRANSEPEVIVWHQALGDLPFEGCKGAIVAHYRDETTWVMPAHVRKRVLAVQQDNAMRSLTELGPDLIPMPDWFRPLYLKTLAEERAKGTYPNRGNLAAAMDDMKGSW